MSRPNFTYNIKTGFCTAAEMLENLTGLSSNESTDLPSKHTNPSVSVKNKLKKDLSDTLFLKTVQGSPKNLDQKVASGLPEMEPNDINLNQTKNHTSDDPLVSNLYHQESKKQHTLKRVPNPYLKSNQKKPKMSYNPIKLIVSPTYKNNTSDIPAQNHNSTSNETSLLGSTFNSIKQNTVQQPIGNQNLIPLNTFNIPNNKTVNDIQTKTTNSNSNKTNDSDKNSTTHVCKNDTSKNLMTECQKKSLYKSKCDDDLLSFSTENQKSNEKQINIKQEHKNEHKKENKKSLPPGIVITGKQPSYDTRTSTHNSNTLQAETFLRNELLHTNIPNLKTKLIDSNQLTFNDDDTEVLNLNTSEYENILLQDNHLIHTNDNILQHYSDDLSTELKIDTPNLSTNGLHPNLITPNPNKTNIHTPNILHTQFTSSPLSTGIPRISNNSFNQQDLSTLPNFKYINSRFSRLSITEQHYHYIKPAFLSQPTAFILLSVEYTSKLLSITNQLKKKYTTLKKWEPKNTQQTPESNIDTSSNYTPKSLRGNNFKLTYPKRLDSNPHIINLTNDIQNKQLELTRMSSDYSKQIHTFTIEAIEKDRIDISILFLIKLTKLSILHQNQNKHIPLHNTIKNHDTLASCIASYFSKYKLPDEFFQWLKCPKPQYTLQILSNCTSNQNKLNHFLNCSLMSDEYEIATSVINEQLIPLFLTCTYHINHRTSISDKIKEEDLLLRKFYEKDTIETSYKNTAEAISNINPLSTTNISQIIADTTSKILLNTTSLSLQNNLQNRNSTRYPTRRLQSNLRGPRQNPRRGPRVSFGHLPPATSSNRPFTHSFTRHPRNTQTTFRSRNFFQRRHPHQQRTNNTYNRTPSRQNQNFRSQPYHTRRRQPLAESYNDVRRNFSRRDPIPNRSFSRNYNNYRHSSSFPRRRERYY